MVKSNIPLLKFTPRVIFYGTSSRLSLVFMLLSNVIECQAMVSLFLFVAQLIDWNNKFR